MLYPLSLPRITLYWFLALGAIVMGLAMWAVGDFSQPMSDGNDTDVYEYVGYYFWKNLTLWPFPHLNLTTNQTFYPYGTNQTFLDWGFERDYWYALCYWLNGNRPGPYIQFYYVYSLVLTALGSFWLLRNRFPAWRLFVFGLAVSVFNFYALFKFPVHLNVCVGHYTVLCIVATYRLLATAPALPLKKGGGVITLNFLIGWATLHVLVLSQELGYVAGFGLAFTTVAGIIMLLANTRNRLTPNRFTPNPLNRGLPDSGKGNNCTPSATKSPHLGKGNNCTSSATKSPLFRGLGVSRLRVYAETKPLLLLAFFLLALWLYLPLALQIVVNARQFDFGDVVPSRMWSHPARLLIPYIPGLDQFTVGYERFFGDSFESFGQGSPGLWLIIAAAVGWWAIRRRVALWLPIVVMLALCLLYHPLLLPTLKIFPWFAFNRHGGRASLIYPVLLGLLALHVPVPKSRISWLVMSGLGMLMLVEWGYPYSVYVQLDRPRLPASFFRYVEVVRQTPGEAILDWPFCTTGADGPTATAELCPHYQEQNAVFTFRRFYDKKGVGQYFGRLSMAQTEPFRRDGWPRLLLPDYVFTEADWRFLDDFLRKNDFAGINLYPDLLAPEQVRQFYVRYGKPVAETRFPAAGRVQFLKLR